MTALSTPILQDHEETVDTGTWWLRAEVVTAVLAALCYINVLPNDYCDDGIPIVRQNAKVNDPGHWADIWTTDYWSETKDATPNRDLLYRPVSLTSYAVVRALFGAGPFPQLALNVLLHALISVVVVRLCRHVKGSNAGAMVAGALFAALPIHTEVIANVVGRADLIATAGVLLAVLWHRRSMIATTSRGIVVWRALAALAAFAAMGSKESGITVVGVVVLMDALWYRRWRAASRDRPWLSVGAMLRFTYLLIAAGVYLALRWHALEGQLYQRPALTKTVNLLVDAPGWQRILGVVQLWGMYWAKTVWPAVLSVNYSINAIRLATSPLDVNVILGLLLTVGLAAASVIAWRRGTRSVAFLSVAIVICYAPTSNALVLIQVFFAERIWYLPSVWIMILVGLAAEPFARRVSGHLVIALLVLAFAERCWTRNAQWENNEHLYAAAYNVHPSGVGALRLYGQTLVLNGRLEEGIELLRRATDIDLGFTDAHRSLGQAYLRAGALYAAMKHLQIANMQVPNHPPTVEALEYVSQELSARSEPELRRLKEAAKRAPDDAEAEVALVRKLRELGRFDEALSRLLAAEQRFSSSVQWQNEYAVTLLYLNRRDEAIDRYYRCIELDPADPHLTVELAMLLLERRADGDVEKAWRLSTRAAQLAPRAPFVLVCRAELLALRGDLKAAGRLYQDAIRSLPPGSEQRNILEARAKALGH